MEEEANIIFDVDIRGGDDLLSQLAALRLQSAQLRQEQRALGAVTEENAEQYYGLDAQIRAINQQANTYQRQLTNSIRLQNQQTESLEALRTQRSLDTAELNRLANTQQNLARRTELIDQIATTTEEINKQEQALGNYRGQVGNYEVATQSLQQQLGELTNRLLQMAAAGDTSSEAYRELVDRAGDLRTAQERVNQEIQGASRGTETITALTQAASGVTAAFGVWRSASALLNTENEDVEKTLTQLAAVITTLQSLQAIGNALSRTSATYRAAENLLQRIGINQTQAEAKAIAAKNVAQSSSNILTRASATVTWLWNSALAANPVVLLAVGVGALVAAMVIFNSTAEESAQATRDYEEAQRTLEVQSNATAATLERNNQRLFVQRTRAQVAGREEIQELRRNNATRQEIAQSEFDLATRVRQAELQAIQQNQASLMIERDALLQTRAQLVAKREAVKSNTDAYNQYTESIDAVNEALNTNSVTITQNAATIRTTQLDQIDADIEYRNNRIQQDLEVFEQQSQIRQRYQTESLRANNVYQTNDIRSQQDFNRQIFEIEQAGQRERLDARRRANAITQQEYQAELDLMAINTRNFVSRQNQELNTYFTQARSSILSLAAETTQQQIDEIVVQYDRAIKDLNTLAPPIRIAGMTDQDYSLLIADYEEMLYNQSELAYRLEREKQERIIQINEQGLQQRLQRIDQALQREYSDDLLRYSDNEREKLRVQAEMLQSQIEQYREAGQETGELEAQLRANGLAQTQLQLDQDLLTTQNNANTRYELRREALEAELELYRDNADRVNEISAQIYQLDRDRVAEIISNIEQYANAAGQIFSGITTIINNNAQAQIKALEDSTAQQLSIIEQRYNSGLISEQQYNRETAKLQAEQEREQTRIERESAIRDRAAKSFQIVTDTLIAVSKSVAASPLTGGMPWSAVVSALGAVNLAALWSEPLPGGGGGGSAPSIPSVSGGGSTGRRQSADTEIFSNTGTAVPFTTPFSDGGYTARAAGETEIRRQDIASAVKDGFNDVTVVATIQDIRNADQTYMRVNSQGNV